VCVTPLARTRISLNEPLLAWRHTAVGFERAATVFTDPTLRTAALTMFAAGVSRQPLGAVTDIWLISAVVWRGARCMYDGEARVLGEGS
jgi:hypothetical protein